MAEDRALFSASVIAASFLLVTAAARDVAGKYLVVVATEPTRAAAEARAGAGDRSLVVATDDYAGLKPHLFLVVASVHDDAGSANGRCRELQRAGTDCYVRRAGTRTGAGAELANEKEAALAAVPGKGSVELASRTRAREGMAAVVVVSYPLAKSRPRYTPTGKNYATAVFVFAGDGPVEIADHDLLKPGERIWEEVHCGPLRVFPLGKERALPVALAQQCNEEGESQFRFLVLDEPLPQAVAKGTATWSSSLYPDARHERFVPNDDPDVEGGLSKRRMDGKTVIEGTEGKQVGSGHFREREFTVEWSGGKLVRKDGAWRDARDR
ncbi:MAG TPA: hypothetical protein VEP66_21845 [Myxococcales bacterium]|nr:hypothetical protein [Myxococcales bacterium]